MEQEIQQNTGVNKKPLMYVSGVTIILNCIVAIFLVLFLLSMFAQASKYPEGTGMIAAFLFAPPFLFFLPVLTILFLIVSLFKKPKQYIQTKFVDAMFIFPVIVTISLEAFVVFSDNSYSLYGFIMNEGYLSIPMFITTSVAIYLNHRFQKPETVLVAIK